MKLILLAPLIFIIFSCSTNGELYNTDIGRQTFSHGVVPYDPNCHTCSIDAEFTELYSAIGAQVFDEQYVVEDDEYSPSGEKLKFCPQCKKEGKKSKIFIKSISSTLMTSVPYYDENGKFHCCDPNTIFINYKCSNGHEWTEEIESSCEE
jgi:hypothetical protein